jgi:hypothetical protein
MKWHSGRLKIDILTRKCFFNKEPVEPLTMAAVLNTWLLDDLQSNDIPMSALHAADLEVDFNVARDPRSRRGVPIIDHNFMCIGRVRSGENLYFCKFQDRSGDQKVLDKGHLTTG